MNELIIKCDSLKELKRIFNYINENRLLTHFGFRKELKHKLTIETSKGKLILIVCFNSNLLYNLFNSRLRKQLLK